MKEFIKLVLPPIILYFIQEVLTQWKYRNYKKLIKSNRTLKNKHVNKRCFILGSGPSIKKQYIELLKNENIIALNNFYVHDKFSKIIKGDGQKYYLTAPTHDPQSREEWINWLTDMSKNMVSNVTMLFGITGYENNIKDIVEKNKLFDKNPIHWYVPVGNSYFDEINYDPTKFVTAANTASIYALYYALYMGFSEIYLVGCDHNYICFQLESEFRFYEKAMHQKMENERLNALHKLSNNTRELIAQAEIFKMYHKLKDSSKAKIINLSPGSLLDIFEKMSFESVYK